MNNKTATKQTYAVPIVSRNIKTGTGILFLDVKEAKNKRLYLSLSLIDKDADGMHRRTSIRLFGDSGERLRDALSEILVELERKGSKS